MEHSINDIALQLRELKPFLTKNFCVQRLGIFGSYASGDHTSQSDLDLLVEFSKPVGWKFFTLEKMLEEKLQLKIDLVTPAALKSAMRENILQTVIYV